MVDLIGCVKYLANIWQIKIFLSNQKISSHIRFTFRMPPLLLKYRGRSGHENNSE